VSLVGTHSASSTRTSAKRVPGTRTSGRAVDEPSQSRGSWAHTNDMTLTVGWNTAQEVGISREEMDRWHCDRTCVPWQHRTQVL